MNKAMFGKRVQEVRKAKNMTSSKLAECCDIEPSFVRQIESANRYPSIPVFVKLCNALGISPDYLLKDSLENKENVDSIHILHNRLKDLTPSEVDLIMDILEDIIEHRHRMLREVYTRDSNDTSYEVILNKVMDIITEFGHSILALGGKEHMYERELLLQHIQESLAAMIGGELRKTIAYRCDEPAS